MLLAFEDVDLVEVDDLHELGEDGGLDYVSYVAGGDGDASCRCI